MFADLDTLLTALYVELTDQIIPSRRFTRSGPGQPPEVTDAERVCIAVAQVLLRYDDERHWLRAAPKLIGRLFRSQGASWSPWQETGSPRALSRNSSMMRTRPGSAGEPSSAAASFCRRQTPEVFADPSPLERHG